MTRVLIETVDGVPIYRRAPDPLALVPGRRGRLVAGGPVLVVDRVSPCGAYLHPVYDPPLSRPAPDGSGRMMLISRGPAEPGISRSARFVEVVS